MTTRTALHPLLLAIATVALATLISARAAHGQNTTPPQFRAVDVYLDSAAVPLAAYQLEIIGGETNSVRIVGVEGGQHTAFQAAPHYDPAALQRQRVIIAAFSTGNDLPSGRTRVARIHLLTDADAPACTGTLIVAADANGTRIPVKIQLEEGAPS